jgi:hypothetical protein
MHYGWDAAICGRNQRFSYHNRIYVNGSDSVSIAVSINNGGRTLAGGEIME